MKNKLYNELLNYSYDRIKKFLTNVQDFENHFIWSEYNNKLYELMYENNSYSKFKTVKELKDEVPELKDLCKKCASYFIPAKNKSIPKYDVILGKQYEDILIEFINKITGIKTGRADLKNRKMPDCGIFRDSDVNMENPLALFEVKFHGAPFVMALNKTGRYCYEGSATLDYKKIEKQLEITKDMRITIFYLHWIEYPCLKGVFYETSKQVDKYIKSEKSTFERKERDGDNLKSYGAKYFLKMYSPLLEMGSFENFIIELKNIYNKAN